MGGEIECSRDSCPTASINPDYTTTCGKCNATVHLHCIGISHKTLQVLWHPNIRILCSKCIGGDKRTPKTPSTPSTPNTSEKPALEKLKTFEFRPSILLNDKNEQRQLNSSESEASITAKMNSKINLMYNLLQKVHTSVEKTNNIVSSQVEASKSYSEALKEIKDVAVSTKGKLDDAAANIGGPDRRGAFQFNGRNFPSIENSNKSVKRRCPDNSPTPAPKIQFKHRTLVPGKAGNVDHGLGDSVSVTKSKRTSPYAHLVKSIYISRLQPTVTIEKITDYVKKKMPELKDNDISLRMLVKKDQPLDELTYISYRLACTEEHYSKFMDSEFWPAHVMIGEFIERERKQANVGDFMATPSKMHQSTPAAPKNVNEKTPTMETE